MAGKAREGSGAGTRPPPFFERLTGRGGLQGRPGPAGGKERAQSSDRPPTARLGRGDQEQTEFRQSIVQPGARSEKPRGLGLTSTESAETHRGWGQPARGSVWEPQFQLADSLDSWIPALECDFFFFFWYH